MAGIAFLILTGMYFLPTILAAAGGKRNAVAIGALNFFTGWTFVGWVISLIWALCAERGYENVIYMPYATQWPQQQSYVPPQQAQYIDRNGPPMNVTPGRKAPSSFVYGNSPSVPSLERLTGTICRGHTSTRTTGTLRSPARRGAPPRD